jgi:hypothetical protein
VTWRPPLRHDYKKFQKIFPRTIFLHRLQPAAPPPERAPRPPLGAPPTQCYFIYFSSTIALRPRFHCSLPPRSAPRSSSPLVHPCGPACLPSTRRSSCPRRLPWAGSRLPRYSCGGVSFFKKVLNQRSRAARAYGRRAGGPRCCR